MKCPDCEKLGLTSEAYPGHCTRTAAYCQPFYDSDGMLHDHDTNATTMVYTCSNDHEWVVNSTGKCWCGWDGSKDIFSIAANNPGIITEEIDNEILSSIRDLMRKKE